MSKKWVFKHNPQGYFELMKSEEMQNILNEYGNKVMNNLEPTLTKTYEMQTVVGRTRSNVTVRATSIHAKRDNLKHNTLLKALGSAKWW